MSRGIETDALPETPEAEEPRIPSAPAHPVTGEPAAFDPTDLGSAREVIEVDGLTVS